MFFVPVVDAGSPEDPNMVDTKGDATRSVNDILAAWIGWTPQAAEITIQMGSPLPALPCPDLFPRWFVNMDLDVRDGTGNASLPGHDYVRLSVEGDCNENAAGYRFEMAKHASTAGANAFNLSSFEPMSGSIEHDRVIFRPEWSQLNLAGEDRFTIEILQALSRTYYGVNMPGNTVSEDAAPDNQDPHPFRFPAEPVADPSSALDTGPGGARESPAGGAMLLIGATLLVLWRRRT